MSIADRLLKLFIDRGFGIGKQEKMILVRLQNGREVYMSQLRKTLSRLYLEEKWNQTTLKVRIDHLRDLGMVDVVERDFKKYVRISSLGRAYLRMMPKWGEDLKRMCFSGDSGQEKEVTE